tara:strand:+ start:152 stop:562 length:411 start_codon:yes stop_codon:yes gene_type:complete
MTEDDRFKFLHTMIRVRDLDTSLDFYLRLLGMKLLRRAEFPDGRFTNCFIGYGDEASNTVMELTYNWDQNDPYEHGNGYGHIALGVSDIYDTCEKLKSEGVNIPRPPGPMLHGTTVIAFIEDPDGYKIELIEIDSR